MNLELVLHETPKKSVYSESLLKGFFKKMWSYLRWRLIRFLCARVFLKYTEQPVLQEWGDPVETFKETHIHGDWGRFVTYVVWLKQFPLAAEWYSCIETQFGSQVPSWLELLSHWIE